MNKNKQMNVKEKKYSYKGVDIVLRYGNITHESVDVIVNAANSGLLGGGGVDGAIHNAGGPSILDECREIIKKINRLDIGKVAVTGAGDLKAKYVLHTVGPIWLGGKAGEKELLECSYINCLDEAFKLKQSSIAFPSISTGAYGYPVEEATEVAIGAVKSYIEKNNDAVKEIRFVVFSDGLFERYKRLLQKSL